MKKRKRKDEGTEKEKKPRKMKVPKQLGYIYFFRWTLELYWRFGFESVCHSKSNTAV